MCKFLDGFVVWFCFDVCVFFHVGAVCPPHFWWGPRLLFSTASIQLTDELLIVIFLLFVFEGHVIHLVFFLLFPCNFLVSVENSCS